jgi:putative spermidine/putrescine transport system ATP-binding protein
MVFQSYALFPHLTTEKNIAFGLKMRGVPPPERLERVADVMKLVQIQGLGDRLPAQLSGGQQQRVALARALVINPSVLLLDEPLSNLDAKLREETREELKRLQRRLAITTIFVTHDQEEALVLADRIVIMRDGDIEQVGDPPSIYKEPATRFVGRFIGACNFVPALVKNRSGEVLEVSLIQSGVHVRSRTRDAKAIPGATGDLMIRPEAISLQEAPQGCAEGIRARLMEISYRGSYVRCSFRLGDDLIMANLPAANGSTLKEGADVRICIDGLMTVFFSAEGKERDLTA